MSALQGMTLTRFNTLGLTCEAKPVMTLSSQAQLPEVTARARATGGIVVLGGGSNVVLPVQLDRLVVRVAL
jgi:UDP-N-acetylmuramate dehydrogenase